MGSSHLILITAAAAAIALLHCTLVHAEIYSAEARKTMLKAAEKIDDAEKFQISKTCYMDLAVEDKAIGRIEIGMFGEVAPITTANFAALCRGDFNRDSTFGYKNSRFHRFVQDFVLQGGDITNFDGSGGKSIFGENIADEPIVHSHKGTGYVSMANKLEPNTASSQFFITLAPARWLDGHHVVFGKVTSGMEILHRLNEKTKADPQGVPLKDIVVSDCGLLKHKPYLLEPEHRV